ISKYFIFFFFQAEDGIRDRNVTGVQTCALPILASALSYATTSSSYLESVTLLLSFSFGLGIPFILSALLLNEMNHVLTWIKQHYRIIQTVSALFLIVMGISTMFGWLEMALLYLS